MFFFLTLEDGVSYEASSVYSWHLGSDSQLPWCRSHHEYMQLTVFDAWEVFKIDSQSILLMATRNPIQPTTGWMVLKPCKFHHINWFSHRISGCHQQYQWSFNGRTIGTTHRWRRQQQRSLRSWLCGGEIVSLSNAFVAHMWRRTWERVCRVGGNDGQRGLLTYVGWLWCDGCLNSSEHMILVCFLFLLFLLWLFSMVPASQTPSIFNQNPLYIGFILNQELRGSNNAHVWSYLSDSFKQMVHYLGWSNIPFLPYAAVQWSNPPLGGVNTPLHSLSCKGPRLHQMKNPGEKIPERIKITRFRSWMPSETRLAMLGGK